MARVEVRLASGCDVLSQIGVMGNLSQIQTNPSALSLKVRRFKNSKEQSESKGLDKRKG